MFQLWVKVLDKILNDRKQNPKLRIPKITSLSQWKATKRGIATSKNGVVWLQLKYLPFGGHLVAQLVKRPTLVFGSGHDLSVHEFESHVSLCSDSAEPAWDSPFLSLSLSLSLKKKKLTLN